MRIIREKYTECASHYTTDRLLIESLWQEIERRYSAGGRHYHTLEHLDHVTNELLPFRGRFADWDTVVFAIAYHDVIYRPIRNDNEEKSADFARRELAKIGLTTSQIERCRNFILATKKHKSADAETDLFTDADLSILGADSSIYANYASRIRNEYKFFPNMMYNPGRKKVLLHFLTMNQIFKTAEFASRYEERARSNLKIELGSFSKL